jgi:tetratricopeptide (TPR) repeat protein
MSHRIKKNRLPDNRDPGRGKGAVRGTADRRGLPEAIPPSNLGSWTHNAYAAAAVCGLLVLAVALVFGQTVGHEFVQYDDPKYVYQNPVVQRGLTFEGFRWALTYGEIGHWHPLTWYSHMLDSQLYGLRAGGHHLTNVLVHAAAVVSLFLVLWRMTGFLWRSAFVAAVFAVHPLRAESVAWVSERKDVLSGLFFMLTIGAYVRYVRRPTSMVRYGMVVLLFALGLLSKNMLVTLPFLLLLLDYWPLNRVSAFTPRIWLRLAAEKWPLFLLSFASCVITFLVPEKVPDTLSLALRMENAVVSYVIYLWQMIYPLGLAANYPNPVNHLPFWQVGGAAGLLLAISGVTYAYRRKHPYLIVGWLWYLGMMIPVIGIVQISHYAHADRYTYLPQIGIYLMLTWMAASLCAGWRNCRVALGCVSAIILSGLIYSAHTQVSYWRNTETLWTHALGCTAGNYIAHVSLGAALAERGQTDAAIAHFQKALEIKPDYPMANNNLGRIMAERGQIDAAIAHFQRALEINPVYAEAHFNFGVALEKRGQIDAAIAHYQKAVGIKPGFAEARNNLGVIMVRRGQVDEAIAHFQKALEINPDYAEARFNIGVALEKRGQMDAAITHYQKALEIKPGYAEAHNNLGAIMARRGQVDAAIAHFQKALEIKPDYANARDNLDLALKSRGQTAGSR